MRIVFMGTPDFAVETLELILEAGHEIVLAVTQPDKPRGRGGKLQAPAVKECARKHGIEVFQPKKIREQENIKYLKEYHPDMIVVAAFGQILPKEILSMPRYGCINVHASLLPKYRGAAPIQWAVIHGDEFSGVTIMRMEEGLDTGDIIEQEKIRIAEDETGGSLFLRLSRLGAELCVLTMKKIQEGTAVYTRQEDALASHVGMISKEMGHIDWSRPAKEIECLIRGLNPWPSAYTILEGKTLKIWKARVLEGKIGKQPGRIKKAGRQQLLAETGDGVLELLEVQLEGKKRMGTDAFLNGYELPEGTVLH